MFVAIFRWLEEGPKTPPEEFVHRLQFIAETIEGAAYSSLNEKKSAGSIPLQ